MTWLCVLPYRDTRIEKDLVEDFDGRGAILNGTEAIGLPSNFGTIRMASRVMIFFEVELVPTWPDVDAAHGVDVPCFWCPSIESERRCGSAFDAHDLHADVPVRAHLSILASMA